MFGVRRADEIVVVSPALFRRSMPTAPIIDHATHLTSNVEDQVLNIN